jgi:hypothetical protein
MPVSPSDPEGNAAMAANYPDMRVDYHDVQNLRAYHELENIPGAPSKEQFIRMLKAGGDGGMDMDAVAGMAARAPEARVVGQPGGPRPPDYFGVTRPSMDAESKALWHASKHKGGAGTVSSSPTVIKQQKRPAGYDKDRPTNPKGATVKRAGMLVNAYRSMDHADRKRLLALIEDPNFTGDNYYDRGNPGKIKHPPTSQQNAVQITGQTAPKPVRR